MKKISQTIVALLLACTAGSASAADTLKGDVNGDQKLTVADVTSLVKVLMGQATANDACKVNDDEVVDSKDVLALVDLILGRTPKDTTSTDISDEPATEPAQAPRRGGQFDE